MHDACEDLGQNYLKADIMQSLALGLLVTDVSSVPAVGVGGVSMPSMKDCIIFTNGT